MSPYEAMNLSRYTTGYLRARGVAEDRHPAEVAKTGEDFPIGKGDVSGTNGLWRVNWFNGRFLTAEALRSQDIYWDRRARLLGRVHPPGVAYGIDVSLDGYSPSYGLWDDARGKVGTLTGGAPARSDLLLGAGLAFDGLGRPIVVGKAHKFPFRLLLERWQDRPLRVRPGGTRFMGCVCLEEDRFSGAEPGPAAPPGSYLLLIRAEENRDGAAKVYGELCGDGKGGGCEADGYLGGYGLFLARLPVDVAPAPDLRSPWDVRGTLSAWYFDVFEHSLIRRWDPTFAAGDEFCPSPEETGKGEFGVPLALVHIGSDGSICALDAWIPRRMVTATHGVTWTQALIGHSPPAAAYARLHQFQCMLHESLELRPFLGDAGNAAVRVDVVGSLVSGVEFKRNSQPDTEIVIAEGGDQAKVGLVLQVAGIVENNGNPEALSSFNFPVKLESLKTVSTDASGSRYFWIVSTKSDVTKDLTMKILKGSPVTGIVEGTGSRRYLNLYDRGFRHIPPMGFLPFDASVFDWREKMPEEHTALDNLFLIAPVSRLVWAVDRMAEAYFRGTNVLTYTVVAVHDDDMLEDWNNVHTKDPIQLRRLDIGKAAPNPETPDYTNAPQKISAMRTNLRSNRMLKADVGSLFTEHSPSSNPLLSVFGLFFNHLKEGFDGLGSLANREIEFVKIMVPLQGTRRLFPVNGPAPEDFRSTFEAWMAGQGSDLAQLYQGDGEMEMPSAFPRHFVAYVKQRIVLLDQLYLYLEVVAEVLKIAGGTPRELGLVTTAVLKRRVSADSRKSAMAKAVVSQPFAREILVQSALQASPKLRNPEDWSEFFTKVDAHEKNLPRTADSRIKAMGLAADEFAVDNEGFGIVKLLLAADDTPAVEGSLRSIQEAAIRNPLRDATGKPLGKSLPRQVFRAEDTKALNNEAQLAGYAAGKAVLMGKTVRETTGMASDATVEEVFLADQDHAADLLGGEANLKTFVNKLRTESQKVAKTVESLGIPDANLAKDYAAALVKHAGKADKAVAELARKYSGNDAKSDDLKKLASFQKILGSDGLAKVAGAYFGKASGKG